MQQSHYTILENVLGVAPTAVHTTTAAIVVGGLALATIAVFPKLRKAEANVIPDAKFGLKNGLEMLMDMMAGLCKDIIGKGYEKYFPFVGSVFFFILFSNLIGMIPGFTPPTGEWVTGAAVAIIVFIAYNFFGISENGLAYGKHFLAPISAGGVKNIFAKTILMVMIIGFQAAFAGLELISHIIRPIALTMRLTVNIFVDHLILGVFSDLVALFVPIAFMSLGLLVSFIQAFVFTLLTMVYISIAVAHDH